MNKNRCYICRKPLDNFADTVYVRRGYNGVSLRLCDECGSVLEQKVVWWQQNRREREVVNDFRRVYKDI